MKAAKTFSASLARKLSGFWLFSSATALICTAWLLSIPSETYAGMPFGLSPIRLGLSAVLLGALIVSLLLANFLWRHGNLQSVLIPFFERHCTLFQLFSLTVALPALFFTLLPASQSGGFDATLTRARPILAYVSAVGGVAALALSGWRYGWQPSAWKNTLYAQRYTLRLAGGLLLAALALILFAYITGIGLTPDTQGWNTPSIPVSSLQILAVLLALVGLLLAFGPYFASRLKSDWHWRDTVVLLTIWLAAAVVWNLVPLPSGFFAPGPYPPDYQYHPFSDAVRFDNGAQYLLMGEGIQKGAFTDRPIYIAFLALLHAIAGQTYDGVISLQVVVFALFPAVLYALGRQLHSRTAGLLLAALFILQEINTINATRTLNVSHLRWMLTEFPAMMLMGMGLLAFIMAFSRQPFWPYLALSGGIMAIAAMVRTNPLFLFLACVPFWFFSQLKSPRRAISGAVVMAIAFLICSAPWALRTTSRNHITVFYLPKIENVLKMRFLRTPASPTVPSPNAISLPGSGPAATPAASANTVTTQARSAPSILERAKPVAQHSLHTVIASLFILPAHPDLTTLSTALERYPYTDAGLLSPPPGTLFLLLLNLILITLGIALAWRKLRWAGLAPLLLFLSISLSNGFARSSGGRYQVGSDWIMLLYFSLGVVEIIFWVLTVFGWKTNGNPLPTTSIPARWRLLIALMTLVLLISAAPPLAEVLIPQRTIRTAEQMIAQPGVETLLPAPVDEIERFSKTEGAVVRYGRLLFPRFYFHDRGEPDRFSSYRARPYPRMVFELLSSSGRLVNVLPIQQSPTLSSGVDALLIGCQDKNELQIHTLIIFPPGEPHAYTREPYAPLECPIPEPVCDNNHNCR